VPTLVLAGSTIELVAPLDQWRVEEPFNLGRCGEATVTIPFALLLEPFDSDDAIRKFREEIFVSVRDEKVESGETNPNNADGLRDGQETAGWRVGIWYERTMEKKTDYQVTSSPFWKDSENSGVGDGLTDFSEFLNGSDPTKTDTDGDGITDPTEIQQHSNITGIEGSPPQISNVKLTVSIRWDWLNYLYLPVFAAISVDFDVSDNVGIDSVAVKVVRVVGSETHTAQITAGSKSGHIHEAFGFSLVEAVLTGADVNISAYDINGNGAWGEFHVDSLAQAVVKAVVAYFTAIAKVIVEALSGLMSWVLATIVAMTQEAMKQLSSGMENLARGLVNAIAAYVSDGLPSFREGLSPEERLVKEVEAWITWIMNWVLALVITLTAVAIIARIIIAAMSGGAAELGNAALAFASIAATLDIQWLLGGLEQSFMGGGSGAPFVDFLASLLPGGGDDVSNQVGARSVVLAVLALLVPLIIRILNQGKIPGWGFAAALVSFILTGATFGIKAKNDRGDVPIIFFLISMLSVGLAYAGFVTFFTKERNFAMAFSPVLGYIETALVVTSVATSSVDYVLSFIDMLIYLNHRDL